jgi:hypothetical protein
LFEFDMRKLGQQAMPERFGRYRRPIGYEEHRALHVLPL